MTQFLTRVELHGAEEGDYDVLHEGMKKQGFSRTVFSTKRIEYHLPPAEYIFNGEISSEDVCLRAMAAAAQTYVEFGVLVAEVKELTWHGLRRVAKD